MKKFYLLLIAAYLLVSSAHAQTIGILESANNETAGTAQLITNPAKVKGNVFPNDDVDWYKFTGHAGDRVYAAVMTSHSASGSTDGQLRLFGSDGITQIEFDEDDGSLGTLSSSIAGGNIPQRYLLFAG